MSTKTRLKRKKPEVKTEQIRVCLSIPQELWPWFEKQRKLPKYGNRSRYVRALIVDHMEADKKAR